MVTLGIGVELQNDKQTGQGPEETFAVLPKQKANWPEYWNGSATLSFSSYSLVNAKTTLLGLF